MQDPADLEACELAVAYTLLFESFLLFADANGLELIMEMYPQPEVGAYNTALAKLNPIRYRGYYFDNETGWYFLQTRYYNPEWRRFINADVLFCDGESVNRK